MATQQPARLLTNTTSFTTTMKTNCFVKRHEYPQTPSSCDESEHHGLVHLFHWLRHQDHVFKARLAQLVVILVIIMSMMEFRHQYLPALTILKNQQQKQL